MRRNPHGGRINLHDPDAIRARWPVLVAHRGGVIAANAPENSLGAIHLAALHGYDMVELDLREARDGEPVLFHGSAGRGMWSDCGVPRFVEELTSEELVALRYRGSNEHIATFAQALDLCASLGLGVHQGSLEITAPGAVGSPVTIPVSLELVPDRPVPAVENLQIEPSDQALNLTWTIPADPIVHRVIVRSAPSGQKRV